MYLLWKKCCELKIAKLQHSYRFEAVGVLFFVLQTADSGRYRKHTYSLSPFSPVHEENARVAYTRWKSNFQLDIMAAQTARKPSQLKGSERVEGNETITASAAEDMCWCYPDDFGIGHYLSVYWPGSGGPKHQGRFG